MSLGPAVILSLFCYSCLLYLLFVVVAVQFYFEDFIADIVMLIIVVLLHFYHFCCFIIMYNCVHIFVIFFAIHFILYFVCFLHFQLFKEQNRKCVSLCHEFVFHFSFAICFIFFRGFNYPFHTVDLIFVATNDCVSKIFFISNYDCKQLTHSPKTLLPARQGKYELHW